MLRLNGFLRSCAGMFALAALCGGALLAQTPATPATRPATKPDVKIYDEQADAKTQIATALARAKKDNQRVLIQWGGNWCSWCIALHSLYEKDKDIAHVLSYEYQLVLVDSGQNGKNVDFAKSYGADLDHHGYPYLTVLDANGKVLANQDTGSLEVKDSKGESVGVAAGHDKAKVLAFLNKYVPDYLKADDLLAAALAQAKASNRKVFLHFGAPWCPWCHRLEDWMAQPAIAAILKKDFVDLKIDEDRNLGGKDMEKKFGADGGIPWFVFLDASGKPLITSMRDNQNIGYPAQPQEIAHFANMLRKTATNLTDADIQPLLESLKEESRKYGY